MPPRDQRERSAPPTTSTALTRSNLLLCVAHASASRAHRHLRVDSEWCDVCRAAVPE
jgi:hypothetical protein